jgi:hypothetical protein
MERTEYFDNPWALKIDLMLRGIRVVDSGVRALISDASGIDVLLPMDTLVNIPCLEEFTDRSPYELVGRGGGFSITDGEGTVPVTIPPLPKLYGRRTSTGVEFSDIASTHGSYTVITPSPRCEFFNTNVECKYCAGDYNTTGGAGRDFTVEEVLEVVGATLKEGVSKIIYLSVGFSSGDDGGIDFLRPYIQAIKRHFNCLVAVEALPPKFNKWIDETYALGADSVLYNLEIFDPVLFETICPGRAELIGRKRYLDALGYAARIFPNGTVASHLIIGLEPPGSTNMGVDLLTSMGVVPILPIYRPSPGHALRIGPLTAEVIIPVYKHLYRAVRKNRINFNWVQDISIATTPIEASMLTEGGQAHRSFFDSFYRSRIGLKTAWGLSTLRRKLRVKDSKTDSSTD